MKKKVYFSIDLKSFFASCECITLGLDPYKTPLVVANPHQGNGAITLAITPYLKNKGVKSRSRLYEISKNIEYKIIEPHMKLYKDYSQKVIDVYLSFVDKKDLHIYSIDECFLDVTNYLDYYKKNEIELAKTILNEIYNKTKLTATCGISYSIFLAKVSMDIESKNTVNNIAFWKQEDLYNKLWKINNLNKVWKIGNSTYRKLSNMGIYTGKDIANTKKETLVNKFGVLGESLWNNFNGIYYDTIESLNKAPKEKSYSHSNYLLKDYNKEEIKPIILSMCDTLEYRLFQDNKVFKGINYKLTYSNNVDYISKSIKLENNTNSSKIIYDNFINFIDESTINNLIRKIDIHLNKISDKTSIQLSLFDKKEENIPESNIQKTIYDIKNKYGDKIIIKAANLKK